MTAALLVSAALALGGPADNPGPVVPGMSAEQVRQALGPPRQVARQFLYRRYLEQWTYDNPPRLIEFNCVRGQEPRVLTVHQSPSSEP